ncbi:MAG: hypothetical protein ACEQSA_02795 [Weeksellaceae bacterium]
MNKGLISADQRKQYLNLENPLGDYPWRLANPRAGVIYQPVELSNVEIALQLSTQHRNQLQSPIRYTSIEIQAQSEQLICKRMLHKPRESVMHTQIYNPQGRIIMHELLGEETKKHEYSYDEQGRLVGITTDHTVDTAHQRETVSYVYRDDNSLAYDTTWIIDSEAGRYEDSLSYEQRLVHEGLQGIV